MVNFIGKISMMTAVGLATIALSACDGDGSGGNGDTDADDVTAPSVTIDNLDLFDAVVGQLDIEVTAEDDVAVASVTIMVDGEEVDSSTEAPFTISWDSIGTDDGIVNVTAVAVDAAGNETESEGIQVVVINDGEVVELDEGSEDSLVVPDDWTAAMETDVKHHWTSAADGYSRIIAINLFEPEEGQADWELVCDLGTGFCPHSGESLDQSEMGTTSPLIFDSAPEGGFPGGVQTFVHYGFNPQDHIGETLDFEVLVYAFF